MRDGIWCRRLKARLGSHCSRDCDKYKVRKDLNSTGHYVVQLLLSLVNIVGLEFATSNVKEGSMRSNNGKKISTSALLNDLQLPNSNCGSHCALREK